MPEISVIVPVYNVENKLRRCVDSVLAQTFTDFELILVDDGSPDKSGEICEEFANKDSRVRVIHQANKGVSSARNVGIRTAIGRYISFVDSDDYIEAEYLEKLYEGVVDCQLSICGVYYCKDGIDDKSCQYTFDDFSFSLTKHELKLIATLLRDRRFNYVYSKLYIKSIITNNSLAFDERVSLGEDTLFIMDYLKYIHKVYVIGKPYYNYIRYNSNTLTTIYRDNIFSLYTLINNRIEIRLKEMGLINSDILRVVDERRLDSATWAIDSIMGSLLPIKNKIEQLDTICKDKELMIAVNRNNDIVDSNKLYELIKKQSGQLIFYYYVINRIKQKGCMCLRIIIVKMFPHSFIQKVKKCFQIVQL